MQVQKRNVPWFTTSQEIKALPCRVLGLSAREMCFPKGGFRVYGHKHEVKTCQRRQVFVNPSPKSAGVF